MENNTRTNPVNDHWPEDGLENLKNCPVCGSSQRSLLYDNLTDRVFFCAPGTWSLYECKGCGCAYLDPRPSQESIHLAYQQYFTHNLPKQSNVAAMGSLRRLQRSMANGYRNWRFGTHLQPANRFGVVSAILWPGFRQKLEKGFRSLPRMAQAGRLLDIGCGNGSFLDLAKNAGWEVEGVDPDPVSVDLAIKRGLNVRPGGIEAFADMPESFDVITMSHVIEHVHDPYTTLQWAYHLLKPGGFLWLSTPNIRSFGHEYYGYNWRGLEPPRHLVLFNWDAMHHLLEEIGFKPIQNKANNRNFGSLAAKSEALSKGLDPYSFAKVCMRHRIKGTTARVRTFFQPHRTEFITLKAYKT